MILALEVFLLEQVGSAVLAFRCFSIGLNRYIADPIWLTSNQLGSEVSGNPLQIKGLTRMALP